MMLRYLWILILDCWMWIGQREYFYIQDCNPRMILDNPGWFEQHVYLTASASVQLQNNPFFSWLDPMTFLMWLLLLMSLVCTRLPISSSQLKHRIQPTSETKQPIHWWIQPLLKSPQNPFLLPHPCLPPKWAQLKWQISPQTIIMILTSFHTVLHSSINHFRIVLLIIKNFSIPVPFSSHSCRSILREGHVMKMVDSPPAHYHVHSVKPEIIQ